jgi:hypothetical protein
MKINSTFAIHQPNYIPWIGYFYKLANVDKFVFLDSVQYPRGSSFSNRNRIKTAQGETYLTIPITIPSGKKGKVSFQEVQANEVKWKEKHLKILHYNYKKARCFEEIYSLLETTLMEPLSFAELNIALIHTIADYLNITTRTYKLSSLLSSFGAKTNLIVDIGKKVNSLHYYSGTGGGKEYNDETLLSKNGIDLMYSDFVHPVYPQLWDKFIPNLSILDLVFNCGKDSREIILASHA